MAKYSFQNICSGELQLNRMLYSFQKPLKFEMNKLTHRRMDNIVTNHLLTKDLFKA